jgi:Major Facilitator Superfamily
MVLPPPGPLRRLAAGTLASAVGTGAWYTSWALFLTRSVGLAPAQVGVGMTIAGLAGLLAATPLGWLADRLGAREVYAALLLVQAAAALAYLAVSGFAAFLAVACVAQAASAGGGARNALVLGLTEREADRLATLGALRSISHVGWALGALAGAVVIGVDTRAGYAAMLALNAASYLVYAVFVIGVPPVGARAELRGLRVVRDRPYLALAGLMGVLALCWAMLSSGLPLWVALHMHAPRAVSAVIVVFNSAAIALLQVRVSRGIVSPRTAAHGAVLSASALAAACVLFALTAGGGGAGVIVVLAVAAVLHTAGELLFVAASWGLSVPLMPADAPGEYQGVFATGEATALMVAPALMTTLVADWGQPGWVVLALIFLAPAAAAVPVTRWALRTRVAPSVA